MSKVADAHLPIKEKLGPKLPCNDSAKHMKIKRYDYKTWKRKKKKKQALIDDDETIHFPISNNWIWCPYNS